MKKLFVLIALAMLAAVAFAEASFSQIESLIEQKQYRAAEQGLVEIIKNHPQSAKAYYAMAQAQAGLGNQDKAQFALDKARGLDPELKFASSGNVQNLQQAIVPQTAKIEPVHEGLAWYWKWFAMLGVFGLAVWYYKSEEAKKEELARKIAEQELERARAKRAEEREALNKKISEHADKYAAKPATAPQAPAGPAPSQPIPTYVTPSYAPAPTQTVIHHHNDNSNALMNAVIINDILSHSHHDTTRIVEREVIREVPAPAPQRDSSWDTPAPSRSSSWDEPAPSKSSSWDSGSSSSSSSSSWGSGSSSSDSGSSSSWD